MIEPGEAVALDAGILVGEILDLFDNGMAIGITDISATCHMPDVIEAPYRPAMLGEEASGPITRLGGPSCLAGDVIGDYRLPGAARVGHRLDRKSVVSGKRGSVRVDLGGRRSIKK